MTDPPHEEPPPNLDALYAAVGIEPPTMRRADIAALSGIDPQQSVRWWRAMGFAEVGDDDIAFSTADLAVVLRLRALLDAGRIEDSAILRQARLMGASFSRLVNAQLAIVSEGLAEGRRFPAHDGTDHGTDDDDDAGDDIVGFIESTMNFVWRRHLLAALAESMHAGEADAHQAVGFADLSGFSRVSKTASQQQITEIVETFEAIAFDVVSAHEGRVVKLIGDEVMFVARTIDEAVDIAIELIGRLAPIDIVPPIHCGVAFGETVRVGGDVFGPTVNLASRLTELARPETVVVPRLTGAHLIDREDLDARWVRRPYDLKGVGRTRIVSIRPMGFEPDD